MVADRVCRQLRSVGDALAWHLFDFDRRPLITLSNNALAGPLVGKEGLAFELGAITESWEERGNLALLHGITTTLRLGDITVFTDEGPRVADAMPTASDDALVWWTPLVGTIGMVMAHRFAGQAADGPSRWTIEDIAGTFGISATPARALRVIDRLERFALVRRHGNTIAVRLWLPPLTDRQRRRLPLYLADAWDTR